MRGQDEGLTWEAKGGPEAQKGHLLTALSAFGNSVDGGYLIIGAGRASPANPWVADGSEFRNEPRVWISQIASTIISPPAIDVHSFRLNNGRDVAVVAIAPKPDPPVITPSGVVNRRLPGQSPPVVNPVDLRAIVHGGEAARDQARQRAIETMQPLMVEADGRYPVFVLGLGAVGVSSDVAERIWSEAFSQALDDATMQSATNRQYGAGIGVVDGGTAIVAKQTQWGVTQFDLVVRASVSGGVSAAWRYMTEHDVVEDVIREPLLLEAAWRAAHETAMALGDYGPAFLYVYVHAGSHTSTWTRGEGPTSDEVARAVRLMRRERGEVAREP